MSAGSFLALLAAPKTHAALFEPVETTIEGVVLRRGQPAADALITACANGNTAPSPECSSLTSVRTDSAGRFRFMQTVGRRVGAAEREAQRTFTNTYGGVADNPPITFRLRIDFEGLAGEVMYIGIGPAPTNINVTCELDDLLKEAAAMGVRPVAAPGRMVVFDCPLQMKWDEEAK